MEISTLPLELAYQTLIDLPYADVIAYCRTYATAQNLCYDDNFWRSKYRHDFGPLPESAVGWRHAYEEQIRVRGVVVALRTYCEAHDSENTVIGVYRTREAAVQGVIDYTINSFNNRTHVAYYPESMSLSGPGKRPYSQQFSEIEDTDEQINIILAYHEGRGDPRYAQDAQNYYHNVAQDIREEFASNNTIEWALEHIQLLQSS